MPVEQLKSAVEDYISRIHDLRRQKRGVKELTYRTPLENLLNAIGAELDPPISATQELTDTGAGRPDFGLFEVRSGNARGVIETKGPDDELPATANPAQVARYRLHYKVVLETNYRDFQLVTLDAAGLPRTEGRLQLAANADAFFRSRPAALAADRAEDLIDFIVGVMRRDVPITRARDLADDLARHGREARRRLERRPMEDLSALKDAMEQTLGLHFKGQEGRHFFKSTLVQTLFYGLFSGWMLWRQGPKGRGKFDWKDASDYLALPLIGDLYEEIARPRRLADLDLRQPIEWAAASLNNVEQTEFFKTFNADHAITLFYEPFLQAFDPELRKELGVWYTPPEIVKYMVGRVDRLLRTELGIANGLADESVYVLDPAVGTGSYVVEVARQIHETLTAQGHGALAGNEVKRALMTRVFGFEILPAPYVVAHLQLGVTLREMGVRFGPLERAGVYLTNSLTGWEPPKGAKKTSPFSFLDDEQASATRIKRETPILVILGNPPYNAYAGVAQDEESSLMRPYYEDLEKFGVSIRGLNDLYVRFFRLAERRIGELATRGIVCFISNNSWLDGQSHPVMRERLIKEFETIYIDNCNGDKYRTGKRTPWGTSDQSMFTTDSQPVGIQVGVAIATLVNKTDALMGKPPAAVLYRDLWGLANEKRAMLTATLANPSQGPTYQPLAPAPELRFMLTPGASSVAYNAWQKLPDLFDRYYVGVKTSRDDLVVDIDRDRLLSRMGRYFDAHVSDAEIAAECPAAMKEGERYPAVETRRVLLRRGFLPEKLVRFSYRPLDDRWLYWEPEGKLLDEKRVEYFAQVFDENFAFTAAAAIRKGEVEGPLPLVSLGSIHLIERTANIFTLLRRPSDGMLASRVEPNLHRWIIEAVCDVQGLEPFSADQHTYTPEAMDAARLVFFSSHSDPLVTRLQVGERSGITAGLAARSHSCPRRGVTIVVQSGGATL